MKDLFTKLAIIAAFALPQVSLAQTGNPRGIYKLMSIENSQATVTDYLDQYKVCTDSTTLNIFIDAASHFFGIYKNKIYDYTGDTPATPEDKSDLIYDSDLQHFTLKWWVPEQPARQEQPPVFIPNEWCIEKYQKGLFSDDGKIVFDALTQLPQADKENPLIGTWRNIGGIHSLDEEEVARLKKGYPNSEIYYNKSFYVFTPTHWLLTNDGDKGLYNKITYINHDTISDNVSVAPIPLVWLSDDCVALTITNPNNNRVYIVLERVQDRVPVLNRMAYWFVTRDVNWHLQQADAGNHIIQFQVGRAYISGTDVAQDIPKGLDYITKSAEGDFIPAQITLGLSYLRGTYVEQDPAKGFSWLYKAAEQNDPSAQFMVGACYNDGNGVEKNDAEAFKWFERSANQGYAEAQLATGLMYVTGTGIEKDDTLAMLPSGTTA